MQSSEKDEIGMDLFGCEQIEEDSTLLSMKRSRQPQPFNFRWCLYLFRLPAPVMMTTVMDRILESQRWYEVLCPFRFF